MQDNPAFSPCSPRQSYLAIAMLAILLLVVPGLAIFSTSAFAQGVWKWVDKNGVTHYSDQPTPGAKRVDLNTVQTYDSQEATIPTSSSSAAATASPVQRAPIVYSLVEIQKPLQDQSIIATGGQVQVSVRIEPGVQAGHRVLIEMDGKVVSQPDSAATALDLTDVPRGTHTLTASVVNANGQVQKQADAVTFHVIQPSTRRK